jgi:hypothetical protein
VSFIAWQSEFTPPVIYSLEERAKPQHAAPADVSCGSGAAGAMPRSSAWGPGLPSPQRRASFPHNATDIRRALTTIGPNVLTVFVSSKQAEQ